MPDKIMVPYQRLLDFAQHVFIKIGLASEDAGIVAEVLLWANLRGVDSHGVQQIPFYVQEAENGFMNIKPHMHVIQETAATAVIEADLAFGAVVTTRAMMHAIQKARQAGIGWIIIRNTSHQGALGYYSLMAANHDMAGIALVCTPPAMVPYGARAAGVDNSPIAIAVPAEQKHPLILDMATSVVAGGKIALAKDAGSSIPSSWAVDKDGYPTTEPANVAALLPVGGPKGSGLALMFECLSSILINNPLLEPVLMGNKKNEGHQIQNSIVAAIDISIFTDTESYKEHIDKLIMGIKNLPKADGVDEIYVPGERGYRTYEERISRGIPLLTGTARRLQAVAEKLNIEVSFQL